jgi:tRNA threonylcarbamoyladenosine biosynthesis protein TsaE
VKSVARVYSEHELTELAREWAPRIKPGVVVFLEGELGAGKSTLARELVRALCGERIDFSGSPTYPLCLEYWAMDGLRVAHMDFYRLKSEQELQERGLLDVIWDRRTRSLIEWGSLFPDLFAKLHSQGHQTIQFMLEMDPLNPGRRRITVSKPGRTD